MDAQRKCQMDNGIFTRDSCKCEPATTVMCPEPYAEQSYDRAKMACSEKNGIFNSESCACEESTTDRLCPDGTKVYALSPSHGFALFSTERSRLTSVCSASLSSSCPASCPSPFRL